MDFVEYDPKDWRRMDDAPKADGWYETIATTRALGKASDGATKTILGVSLYRDGKWRDMAYTTTFGWRGPRKAGVAAPLGYEGTLVLAEKILSDVCMDFRAAFLKLTDVHSGANELFAYDTQERLMRSDYISTLSMGAAGADERVKHNQNAVLKALGVKNTDETRELITEEIDFYFDGLRTAKLKNRRIAKENPEWKKLAEEWSEVCKHSFTDDAIRQIRKALREGMA